MRGRPEGTLVAPFEPGDIGTALFGEAARTGPSGTMLNRHSGSRPFAGADPTAAMFYYSRNRKGEHPQGHLARYAGILQADAYDGYNQLYLAGRQPGSIREAACWSHGRRPFFAMADIEENARRKAAGKKETHSFRSRSRSCEGSMRCSRSNGPSTARAPRSAFRCDGC
jgi:hypothetical protein